MFLQSAERIECATRHRRQAYAASPAYEPAYKTSSSQQPNQFAPQQQPTAQFAPQQQQPIAQFAPQQQQPIAQYAPQQQQQQQPAAQYAPQQQQQPIAQFAPQQQQPIAQFAPQQQQPIAQFAPQQQKSTFIQQYETTTASYGKPYATTTASYAEPMPEIQYNPCSYYNTQVYWPAQGLSKQYFIQCSWEVPTLFKCPGDLIWNTDIASCDFPYKRTYPETPYDKPQDTYKSESYAPYKSSEMQKPYSKPAYGQVEAYKTGSDYSKPLNMVMRRSDNKNA